MVERKEYVCHVMGCAPRDGVRYVPRDGYACHVMGYARHVMGYARMRHVMGYARHVMGVHAT